MTPTLAGADAKGIGLGINHPDPIDENPPCPQFNPGAECLSFASYGPSNVGLKSSLSSISNIHVAYTYSLRASLLCILASFSACGADPVERQIKICEVAFEGDTAKTFLADALNLEVLFDGLMIGEGPVWVEAQQRLIASDVAGNKMYTWSEKDGASLMLEASGQTGFAPYFEGGVRGSNGAAIDANGDLIFCQHGDRRLSKLSLAGSSVGEIETIASEFGGKRFNSPNDLTIAPSGDIYFSDPPYGFLDMANSNPAEGKMVFVDEGRELEISGIYCFRPSTGKLSLLSDKMRLPNGMVLSPDGRFLYVNSSNMQQREMWRFSTKDGAGDVFYNGPFTTDEKGWFDGMAMHKSGNIFTTGPGGILVISPEGKRIATIKLPDEATNCCFDGDQKYLYVTLLTYVARIEVKP